MSLVPSCFEVRGCGILWFNTVFSTASCDDSRPRAPPAFWSLQSKSGCGCSPHLSATRAQPMTLTTCHTIGPLRCLLLETPHRTTEAQHCRLTAGAARHECSLTQSFKWKLILSSVGRRCLKMTKEWKMYGFWNQNLKIEIEKERGALLSS